MLNQIVERLVRIIKFDTTVWSEIEHDENANTEALIVVLVAAFLGALGSGIAASSIQGSFFGTFFVRLLTGVVINWLLWSYVTMLVGTKLFQGEADFWEMARMLGYANAPALLGVLNFIPCVGVIIGIVAFVLSLIVGFYAVREGLDLPTDKTIITIVIGWVIMLVVYIVLGAIGL